MVTQIWVNNGSDKWAWCLMVPSHYLNQCWLVISNVPSLPWQSSEGNRISFSNQPTIIKISLKVAYLKFHSNLPGANELMKPFSVAECASSRRSRRVTRTSSSRRSVSWFSSSSSPSLWRASSGAPWRGWSLWVSGGKIWDPFWHTCSLLRQDCVSTGVTTVLR